MDIRLLTSEDAVQYRALRLKSLQENPEAFLVTYDSEVSKPIEDTQHKLQLSSSRFTLGCFDQQELVGMVTFIREQHLKTMHKGNIYAMYVSPACRGQKIGKALIKELVQKASALEGLEQIGLTVISGNRAAKQLYTSLGFTVCGFEKNALKYEGQYWDEERMILEIV
ncbi:GNAT family N-acetyltransferase [Paenibacillus nicotianae]|uniref:GNAT family N-acetyltransferase n=1 Tax=Paenibacillus nicotianae TaxID=1526551 RepID=A0ABW4V130_9BACL